MKHILSILFCLILSDVVLAQESLKKVHFGFSAAAQLGIAEFRSELVQENQTGTNYLFGGDVLIDLSPKTQFITGVSFHHLKLKYRDYSPLFPDDVIMQSMEIIYNSYWDFNYSDVFVGLPCELRIKLNSPEKANHFFFRGGLRIQRLLFNSGYVILSESGHLQEKRDPDDYYFDFQKTWLLPNIGLGYEFAIGKGKFSIQPDFEYSLSKIFRKETAVDANGHVRFLGLRIAYY